MWSRNWKNLYRNCFIASVSVSFDIIYHIDIRFSKNLFFFSWVYLSCADILQWIIQGMLVDAFLLSTKLPCSYNYTHKTTSHRMFVTFCVCYFQNCLVNPQRQIISLFPWKFFISQVNKQTSNNKWYIDIFRVVPTYPHTKTLLLWVIKIRIYYVVT